MYIIYIYIYKQISKNMNKERKERHTEYFTGLRVCRVYRVYMVYRVCRVEEFKVQGLGFKV